MRLQDLDHVVAAAAQIVRETEFVIVGSQAILGSFPDAPDTLLRSQEADIYPRNAPEKAIDIEGSLGDGCHFEETYGYFAHAVGPETAKAPVGARVSKGGRYWARTSDLLLVEQALSQLS